MTEKPPVGEEYSFQLLALYSTAGGGGSEAGASCLAFVSCAKTAGAQIAKAIAGNIKRVRKRIVFSSIGLTIRSRLSQPSAGAALFFALREQKVQVVTPAC
jgi:hypothetical protein